MNSALDRLRNLSREDLVENFKKTSETLLTVFENKSEEYDIEYYKEVGGYYLLLRIREKYHRLHNLLTKEGKPSFEPIEDTIKDLATIFHSLYSMLEFELVSIDRLKILYEQAMSVDIDKLIEEKDEKMRRTKRKWWQVWKR